MSGDNQESNESIRNVLISKRILECSEGAIKYERWLRILCIPNLTLIAGGSLLAFGAAMVAEKFTIEADYMALVGGVLAGLHSWMGVKFINKNVAL